MDNQDNKAGRISIVPPKVGPTFFYPAQDSKGHSAKVSFRLVAGWLREVEILTRPGNKFGWQTQSDFLRWAVREALDKAVKLAGDPNLSTLDQQTNAMIDILNEKRFIVTQEQIFRDTEDVIRELQLRQEYEEVHDTLMRLKRQIEAMPESRSKRRWKKAFKDKFSHLVGTKEEDSPKLTEARKAKPSNSR